MTRPGSKRSLAQSGIGDVSRTRTDPLSWILGGLISVLILFPSVVEQLLPTRMALVVVAALIIGVEGVRERRRGGLLAAIGLFLIGVLVLQVGSQASDALGDPMVTTNAQRILVVLPTMAGLGYTLYKSARRSSYLRSFVMLAVVVAVLAAIESLQYGSVLGRDEAFSHLQREGSARAIVGSEHVLVLGAILAGSIPLVRSAEFRYPRAAAVVLLGGVVATGSRWPTVIAIGLLTVALVPALGRWIRMRYRLVRTIAVVTYLALLTAAFFIWKPIATGATGAAYSIEYRFAIYALLPNILESVPIGIGFASIPYGLWLLPSELFGVRDLAATVDSEPVYLAVSFGWIGLAAYVIPLLIATSALRNSLDAGLSALAITVAGIFLALHAWDSIGPLWYAILGACVAAIRWRSEVPYHPNRRSGMDSATAIDPAVPRR